MRGGAFAEQKKKKRINKKTGDDPVPHMIWGAPFFAKNNGSEDADFVPSDEIHIFKAEPSNYWTGGGGKRRNWLSEWGSLKDWIFPLQTL